MAYAPIALFVYNRPRHTRQTLDALLTNDIAAESLLYIFSDAPRNTAANQAVAEVRSCIRNIAGFKSVTIIERETNYGLARSIIDGVSQLCEEYGRVIVLEDDLVTSPCFLGYMNQSLDLYADEPQVMQISGYMFPIDRASLNETFFLGLTTTWGWGVWERSWKCFDRSSAGFLKLQRDLVRRSRFDLEGSYPYFKMFKKQLDGAIDSWGIYWYATVFNRDGLCLFPAQSLVRNIGHDDSGVHSGKTNIYEVDMMLDKVSYFPRSITEHSLARKRLVEFYRKNRPSLLKRVARAFKKILSLKRHVG